MVTQSVDRRIIRHPVVSSLAIAICLAASGRESAANTWDGSVSNLWAAGNNWVENRLPKNTSTVIINDGANPRQPLLTVDYPVFETLISAGTLTLQAILTSPIYLSGTGSLLVDSIGGVTGQIDLTGGSVSNSGTIDGGISMNAGTVTNQIGGSITGTLSFSGGTFTNLGTLGGLNLTTGTVTNSGTVTGAITITGGTFTHQAGSIAQGTITNGAQFNVTGTSTATSSFLNNTTGTLAVTGGNFTGLTALTNQGTITIGAGLTLSAGTISNQGGSITLGNGATLQGTGNTLNNSAAVTIGAGGSIVDAGAINNLAAGQITFSNGGTLSSGTGAINNAGTITLSAGTLNVQGTLANTGQLNLQNGATNNIVNISGGFGGGGTLAVDIDLAARTADRVVVSAGTSGRTTVTLNRIGGAAVHGGNVNVVQGTGTATYTINGITIAQGGAVVVDSVGLYQQTAENIGGSLQLVSGINVPNVGGVLGAVGSLIDLRQSLTEPASPYVTGPKRPAPNTFSIGSWSRALGATYSYRVPTEFPGGTSTTLMQTRLGGFETALDAGLYNLGGTGWDAVLGAMGGQVFGSAGNGDARGTLDAPFGGAYLVLRNDRFTFDALVRRDTHTLKLGSTSLGFQNTRLAGAGWTGLVNAQYRWQLANGMTVAPSAGLVFARTELDSLSFAGTTTSWSAIQTTTARFGLDLSKTHVLADGTRLRPFASLRVSQDLGPKIRSLTAGYTGATLRPGLYGQASLGLEAQSAKTGLAGFLRGDARLGQQIHGFGINAGMRWQF
ncbi:MAG: autotransporter outer membrane beta-barrel domain-containing protein [Beijerinckiaceae bacterium]|nr:autotransporter outer membrane beta-barrel domain-containing protein [Beijerinckiaceae bacterium]